GLGALAPRVVHLEDVALLPELTLPVTADEARGYPGGARGGDGEEEALGVVESPGIDAHDVATHIHQRAAAVAGVDDGRVLDIGRPVGVVGRGPQQTGDD